MWVEHLSLGVPEVDQQHCLLVALVDDLCHVLTANPGDGLTDALCLPAHRFELLDWRLEQLTKYAREHFTGEEELMRARAYPKTESHKLRHKALLAEICIVRTALAEGVLDWDPEATTDRVRDWLVQHILTDDRLFAVYLNQVENHPTKLNGSTRRAERAAPGRRLLD